MKNIHIPTIEELMRPDDEVYGVLVGTQDYLKYYDLKEDKTYTLASAFAKITAITIKDDDVLYAPGRKIKTLFSGKKIAKENWLRWIWKDILTEYGESYEAFALEEHNGTILDASKRGLETLEGKVLLSKSQLEVCHIAHIASIAPYGNDIFALVLDKANDSCFVKFTMDKTDFEVDRLITYKTSRPNKAIIIPYGNLRAKEKEYPFSVLCSCADTLYLNENEVLGSKHSIESFELKSLQGSNAEIIFPVNDELVRTTLNLSNKTKQDPPRIYYHGVYSHIEALKAVRSLTLHNKLVELGKKNVGKI